MKLTSCSNCGVVVDMDNGDNLLNNLWKPGHGPKDSENVMYDDSCVWDGDIYRRTWTCRVCDFNKNIVPLTPR